MSQAGYGPEYSHYFVAKTLGLLFKSHGLHSGTEVVSWNLSQQVKHCQSEEAFVAEQFYYFAWGDAGVPLPWFIFHTGDQSTGVGAGKFWGCEGILPKFSQLARRKIKQTWPPKKLSMSFQIKHVGRHFCSNFQGVCEGSQRFCPDFVGFFPDFHQIKTFGVHLHPLHTCLLHQRNRVTKMTRTLSVLRSTQFTLKNLHRPSMRTKLRPRTVQNTYKKITMHCRMIAA